MKVKKNTNNSHALTRKENPKTKTLSPLVHKNDKRGFFILENLLLFLRGQDLKDKGVRIRAADLASW